MKNQYASHKTALLAKQKGFNEDCEKYYDSKGELKDFRHVGDGLIISLKNTDYTKMVDFEFTCAPTLALLQRWFREKHNIHVNPATRHETADHSNDIQGYYMGEIERTQGGKLLYVGDDNYETYEKALEAGLGFALTFIK